MQQRGVAASSGAGTATASVSTGPAAEVVDRFLNGQRAASPSQVPSTAQPKPASRRVPKPVASEVDIAPFVSEDDVRRAKVLQTKIYINRKTIVTPAARDLDNDGQVMVRTE